MDRFGPEVRMSNAETDCPPPAAAFVFGIVFDLFKSFGFFVVLQLFSQCWNLSGNWACMWRAWKCCGKILSGGRFLFVSVIVVSSDSGLF